MPESHKETITEIISNILETAKKRKRKEKAWSLGFLYYSLITRLTETVTSRMCLKWHGTINQHAIIQLVKLKNLILLILNQIIAI